MNWRRWAMSVGAATILVLAIAISAPTTAIASDDSDLVAADAAYNRGDFATALEIVRELAEQGLDQAQYNLGVLYKQGEGVPQDYAKAVYWYRLAAEQGHASAQFNLGVLYDQGEGVPQDFVVGHMWFNLAAAAGIAQAAEARDSFAESMTGEQIAEAQRLAREWHASH